MIDEGLLLQVIMVLRDLKAAQQLAVIRSGLDDTKPSGVELVIDMILDMEDEGEKYFVGAYAHMYKRCQGE